MGLSGLHYEHNQIPYFFLFFTFIGCKLHSILICVLAIDNINMGFIFTHNIVHNHNCRTYYEI